MMRVNASMLWGLLFVVMAVVANTGQAETPWFQGVGDLSGGEFNSGAYGVSADGLVVVGASLSSSRYEAFRWTKAGGIAGLGDLSGGLYLSSASAASADGSVIVGGAGEAFRWTQAGGMVSLGDLPGGEVGSTAHAVSSNGSVIVGYGTPASTDFQAFRWTQTTGMVNLGSFPVGNGHSTARGVSGDGSVVIGVGNRNGEATAFRWTEATGMVALDSLPGGVGSCAYGISEDGLTIVGCSGATIGGQACRWTQAGGVSGLGNLPGSDLLSFALDTSANGSCIVGYDTFGSSSKAFLWDAQHGMRDLKDVLVGDYGLDLTGWTLLYAHAISDDGTVIVGDGINPSGNPEGWLSRR